MAETVDELFDVLHGQGVSKNARIQALKKLSNKIDLNNLDYDYEGAVKEGMVPDKRGHWDNQFKKMSHITAGTDSMYSNPVTPAGEWSKLDKSLPTGEEWKFTPSLYQQLRIPKEEYQKYFNEVESGKGGAILNIPEEKKKGIIQNVLNKTGKR
jgi:hypothetical protein